VAALSAPAAVVVPRLPPAIPSAVVVPKPPPPIPAAIVVPRSPPANPAAINITVQVPTSPFDWGAWWLDKMAPPLISGIVISIIASVMIARAMERFRGRREHLNKVVDALRAQLVAIQRLGADYWTEIADRKKSLAQEVELEFLMQEISALARVSAPELWSSKDSDGPVLVAELLGAISGPDFGKVKRKASSARVREIAARAAQLSGRLATDRHRYLSSRAWWEVGL
jgi:hypothetical protein